MMPRGYASPEVEFSLAQEPGEEVVVLMITTQAELTQRLVKQFSGCGYSLHLPIATTLEQARRSLSRLPGALASGRVVVLFDETGTAATDTDSVLEELCSLAPVVALLGSSRMESAVGGDDSGHINTLHAGRSAPWCQFLVSGRLDIVPRECVSVALLTSLIERQILRAARRSDRAERADSSPPPEDFGEVLRHDMNNPLTGILGNAELVLARRDQLPATVTARLETIAELAIRLRETVRRLSEEWVMRFGSDTPPAKKL
jgi:signal transduction histidine kinase